MFVKAALNGFENVLMLGSREWVPSTASFALSHADERRNYAAAPDHALDRSVRHQGRACGAESAEERLN